MINNVEVEIIKGIKLDKKNEKIFIRSSPSNEYPKKYKRHEYFSNCNNFIEKQLSFFVELCVVCIILKFVTMLIGNMLKLS